MLRLNLSFEAESVAALDDAARGGRGEMRADEGHALLRASLQEAAPVGAGLVEVNVEVGFPFRMSALYRMVDQVAGYHADLAARCDPYRHMARAMTWRRLGRNLAGDLMSALDPIHQSRVDHRADRILHDLMGLALGDLRPVIPLPAA